MVAVAAKRIILNVHRRTFRQRLTSLITLGFKCTCVFLLYFILSKFYKYMATETFYYKNQARTHPNYTEELKVYYITKGTDSKTRKKALVVHYHHNACNCDKSLTSTYTEFSSFDPENLLISTCSHEGTLFGPGQNVIAYSLYISNSNKTSLIKEYFDMLPENLRRIRELYPKGWMMRVYSDMSVTNNKFLCDLICNSNDFFWCDIRNIPSHGNLSPMMYMTWRFLPVGDPTVESFGSRDLDTYVINREAAVVKDWLAISESKPLYTMRDKRRSHEVDILGGLWEMNNLHMGRLYSRILKEQMIRASKRDTNRHFWGFDQKLLSQVFYASCKQWMVAYDSYHCNSYKSQTMVRPFPTKRINESDIVGVPYAQPHPFRVCPEECRPVYGKDWIYC